MLGVFLGLIMSLSAFSQPVGTVSNKSQEVSDVDGIPVLIKHLPDWENRRDRTTLAVSVPELKAALGDRPILELVDFSGGTEAVTAPYDAGKLLIIEFSTPQGSIDADVKLINAIDDEARTVYRRIGNYNAIVFDATDAAAANALLDQVKYEKDIHWLGDNPFIISAERAFVLTTSDLFLSTAMVIVFGMVGSVIVGIFAGYIFFYFRDGKRSKMRTFSDAGGMTRLNLDGFTSDISSKD